MVSDLAAECWGRLERDGMVSRAEDPRLWAALCDDDVRHDVDALAAAPDVCCEVVGLGDEFWLVPLEGSPRVVAPSKVIAVQDGKDVRALVSYVCVVIMSKLVDAQGTQGQSDLGIFTEDLAREWVSQDVKRMSSMPDGALSSQMVEVVGAWRALPESKDDGTKAQRRRSNVRTQGGIVLKALEFLRDQSLLVSNDDGFWSRTGRLKALWSRTLSSDGCRARMRELGLLEEGGVYA